jgi:hypothetical protein
MKKVSLFFAAFFLLVLSLPASAQTKSNADFFAGKWNVLVAGTPNGDSKIIVSLEKKDGKLEGTILDSTNKEIAKITKVEEKDKSVTVFFYAQNYDLYLLMDRKDDDHVTGNMLNMFDATGNRIKESK